MDEIRFNLFGLPRIECDGRRVEIGLRKGTALAVYLAMTQRSHSRDALAALFWPDDDQSTARANLRRVLHRLNKLLGENVLHLDAEAVCFQPSAPIWLDVHTYWQLVDPCVQIVPSPPQFDPDCVSRLSQAVQLYSEDFLAGFDLQDCPVFDEWQFFEREALRRSLAQALSWLVEACQNQLQFDKAIEHARRWSSLDKMHEPAHFKLMELYAQSGQKSAALRQYQECVRILEEELRIAPQPATIALYETIKTGQDAIRRTDRQSRPPIQYVRSGQIHVAYQVLGTGPTTLVFVSGFVSHLEQIWDAPDLARFLHRLAGMARIILFDKRGIGLSDRVSNAPSMENTIQDILSIMDAVGVDRAVLFGVSEGGPTCTLLAAHYPDRVSALILYGTVPKFVRDAQYPWALTQEQFERWLTLMEKTWGEPISIEYFAPSRADDPHLRAWWARLLRSASSPGGIRAVMEGDAAIDVRHILPAIRVPTLILHRVGDKMMRVEGGRYLAQHIPNAKYVELVGDDHWWWISDTDILLAEIEAFLRGAQQSLVSARVLTSLLQVQVCQSDENRQDIWSEKSSSYLAYVRGEIAHYWGRVAQQREGAILALFDGPTRMLDCAQSLRAAAQDMRIGIRLGLHIGECEVIANQVSGSAVQVVRQIADNVTPGLIVVSSVIKDLADSRFQFQLYEDARLEASTKYKLYEFSNR